MRRITLRILKVSAVFVGLLVVAYLVFSLVTQPSLARDWSPDQAVLARATIQGDTVAITNVRNNTYRTTTDYDVRYYDKVYDLNDIESVWYMVEPFAGHGAGAAHTLVSFGFKGGEYVAVSAEIRKEKGELFSPVQGMLRQYELVYVIADERDVLKLRSNYRHDDVFLYPVTMPKAEIRKMFVSMMERANKLATEPEFYNTLTNTCATNIVAHINEVLPGTIPWSYKIVMPAYSDSLVREVGLIDSRPLEELRAAYRINEKAERYADDPLFSQRIRGL